MAPSQPFINWSHIMAHLGSVLSALVALSCLLLPSAESRPKSAPGPCGPNPITEFWDTIQRYGAEAHWTLKVALKILEASYPDRYDELMLRQKMWLECLKQ